MKAIQLQQFFHGFRMRNQKIKDKLIITYSLLIILFVTGLSGITYFYSTETIQKQSIKYSLGILEQISNNIDINLEQIDLASYIIFSNPNILQILNYGKEYFAGANIVEQSKAEKLMIDVMFSRRDIDSIYLYDNWGNRLGTNSDSFLMPFEALYQRADEYGGKFVWLDTDKERRIIPAIRMVRNVVMKPVGVLVMNIKESSLSGLLSKEMEKMKGQVFIINNDGQILSGTNKNLIGTTIDQNIYSKISNTEGFLVDTINGEKSIITYYPSKMNNWKYIGFIPWNEITRDASKLGVISFFACVGAIILFILVSYVLVSGITGPIHQMAEHMKTARIKDWMPKIDYKGNDEIGYLSEAFNEMIIRINALLEEIIEQKYRQSRQELKALQAQINPHFLYNTMEVVNWMARSRGVPEIGEITKAISDIMRYSVNHQEEIVIIEKELEHVKNYCLIQMFRYVDCLQVTYEVEEEVLDCKIQKLTLQPIVENAIVHGFKGCTGMRQVNISGCINEGKVQLKVTDNGIGIKQDAIVGILSEKPGKQEDHTGIGVFNVHRRIQLMYGDEYGLKITSIPTEGTTVEILLPIHGEERF